MTTTPPPPSMDSSSKARPTLPQYQVFINFRGAELRTGFIGFLVDALKREGINVFIDEPEVRGIELSNLFTRIQESKIALTIFSKGYTESAWCLHELVKIKECMDQGNLLVIPVFFNVKAGDVKKLTGKFGYNFQELVQNREEFTEKVEKWKQALESVSARIGLCSSNYSYDSDLVKSIVEEVKKLLNGMAMREEE